LNNLELLKIKNNLYALKLRLKKPISRSNDVISNEYEDAWNKASICENIIIRKNPNEETEFLHNNSYNKDTHVNFTKIELDEYLRYVKNSCNFDDPIVELGCGAGTKLFYLEDNGFTNLEGYELTSNGVKKALEFSKIKNSKIRFQQADILKNDIDIKNKTVLTFLSLEQFKLNLEFIIEKILKNKPKQVLSFESVFKSIFEKWYASYTGYQTNYHKLLEDNNQIRLLEFEKFNVNANLLRPIYFMKWTPENNNV
tara:strand:+ start:404 stop:1168 length:765 start_codon:yes stop_codon:yes gene_type:complete